MFLYTDRKAVQRTYSLLLLLQMMIQLTSTSQSSLWKQLGNTIDLSIMSH